MADIELVVKITKVMVNMLVSFTGSLDIMKVKTKLVDFINNFVEHIINMG